MKKLLSILFLGGLFFFAPQSYAQETIVFSENFNNFIDGTPNSGCSSTDISATLDTYTQQPGWTGTKVYQAGGAVKLGTSSIKGWIQLPAIDLSANGGNFIIRFKSMAWNGDKRQLKIIVNGNENIVDGLNNNTSYTFSDFELFLSGGTNNTVIRFEGLEDAKSRFFLEDLTISTFSGALIAFNPMTLDFGDVTENSTQTLSTVATGFNLTENSYTVTVTGTGYATTVTSLTKAELTAGATIPVSLNTTAAGNYAGTLTITGTDLTNPATTNLTATCVTTVEISTIAELRSKLSIADTTSQVHDATNYLLVGNVIVTSYSESGNNFFATIQDETGAILIYDNGGNFISNLEQGQEITDIYGTLINYYGLLEFIPKVQAPRIVSPFTDPDAITPLDVTIETMNDYAFMTEHQSELIKLTHVKFTTAGTFTYYEKYSITDGNATDAVVFAFYKDANYIGTTIPLEYTDLTGVSYMTRGKYYIIPRSMDDLVNINDVNVENQITVYPNPANNQLFIQGLQPTKVEFYNVLGNLIYTIDNPTQTLSITSLANGTYFVKITTEEGVAVKQIVKQ
ncbi:MAG TPA: T9SS type A sorting domain-containing protein [Bacteroidales bacterium]|jgi:hypothetical protein|nr:T9SS type A sorting domain-containing protein [Bacteroidales bacterium]